MVTAIIPVRKGSERVPNKNIKKFAGTSLLEIKIRQLLQIDLFDNVIVSSDCDDMLSLSKKLGAKAHRRDDYYCLSTTPMQEVYRYLGREFESYKTIAYINVTNPLIDDEIIRSCVELYNTLDESGRDVTINTATLLKEFLWFKNQSVNYDAKNQPRSQDLPDYYTLNFACNVVSAKFLEETGMIVSEKHIPVFVDKVQSLDIDDIYDFEIAETIYKKRLSGS